MRPFFIFSAALLVASLAAAAEPTQQSASVSTPTYYLFSYFKGNGEDGLHLAYSRDGLKWTALRNDRSFLKPEVGKRLMRDPSICRGPDGTFHMVWTTGWGDQGIGMAHSKDLIHWSKQEWLPVMKHEPKALNCWAPEIFYDASTQQYLIFWATTIPGRFPETDNTGDSGSGGRCNHRIYVTTTKDFQQYSKTKLFYDDGFNVIDAAIAKEGDQYLMFLKDETKLPEAKKHICVARSNRAEGPYGHASKPISPNWVEGPTALRVGSAWIVYFDQYTRGCYGAVRSTDLENWEDVSEQLTMPTGIRHGTAFVAPENIVRGLLADDGSP